MRVTITFELHSPPQTPGALAEAGHGAEGARTPTDDAVWLSTTQRDTPRRDDLDATSALSGAVRTQLQRLAGEVRQQLDAGHMPNGNDLDRLARWAQQAARHTR